jgi:hypothetical protein
LNGAVERSGSIRVALSTLITSAPKSEKSLVVYAPAPIQVKSAIRTPASGPRRPPPVVALM